MQQNLTTNSNDDDDDDSDSYNRNFNGELKLKTEIVDGGGQKEGKETWRWSFQMKQWIIFVPIRFFFPFSTFYLWISSCSTVDG